MSESKLLKKKLSAEEQYDILSSGAVELINKEEFLEKLKEKPALKVKAGFDPSRPDIHIGHSVLIHKLCQFQELGHEVIFVVGDFTACIGDPSGQNKTRPMLSFSEVKDNSRTYIEQATKKNFTSPEKLDPDSQNVLSFFKRLDLKKTKWLYNSEWFDKVSLKDFILSVSSKFTVARQLERNDFSSRYKERKPIGLHEFFYPVLQAYDSVQIKADVEIGGTDQLFNLLLGRELQEKSGQSPQVVLTLPLLEGLDVKKVSKANWNIEGGQKMSKSLNNAISFNDSPKDVYGKVMSISDQLLVKWWKIFTAGKVKLEDTLKRENINPKLKKEELAWVLVCSLYGEKTADRTREEFSRVFSKKGLPDQILEEQDLESKKIGVCELIKKAELSSSNSEARRAILSGAVTRREVVAGVVEKEGEKLIDPQAIIDLSKKENKEFVLSFGKRKFKRVNLKWKEIHELKALLVYKKVSVKEEIKEDAKNKLKEKLCEEWAKDKDFEISDISPASIKMKFENNRYLDTGKGLPNYSKQNKEVFDKWKDSSIEELEQEIIKRKNGGEYIDLV
ncbi:MAG: tyrosine--tRNA ligase [Oligoflexia bacterium]|nr:tyrosine--tRNA ligase [Oligoflexia bacterium]